MTTEREHIPSVAYGPDAFGDSRESQEPDWHREQIFEVRQSTVHRAGIYGWSPGRGGVHHHRIGEPLRVLDGLGVNVVGTGARLGRDLLDQCDTILAHTLHGIP